MPTPIKTYSLPQLEELVISLGQPKFRAKQLAEWIYAKNATSYDEMSNLPQSLRASLAEMHPLTEVELRDRQISHDGTRKYVLSFEDGNMVETVGLPALTNASHNENRLTVCMSSQVGCAMGCVFCATGKEGFTRNLSVGEMTDQVAFVEQDFQQRVSNVVVMGQGEPFLNYDNTLAALRILNDKKYVGIGARHITISTCGIIEGIQRLSTEPEQFTLAISLHSSIQSKRDKLMPRVKNQPLVKLKAALLDYVEKTNRRVSFEYLLLKGINDQPEDLEALKGFCRGILSHVNLLPMNSIQNSPYQPSDSATVSLWLNELESAKIETTFRKSRGSDISGACGQLKNAMV